MHDFPLVPVSPGPAVGYSMAQDLGLFVDMLTAGRRWSGVIYTISRRMI